MRPKRIYKLMLGENVIYIGQTRLYLHDRLKLHYTGTKGIRELPDWLKRMISIEGIEWCYPPINPGNRERYWIRYFVSQGAVLINKNHAIEKGMKEPKHHYQRLTNAQKDFIKSINYSNAGRELKINAETVRVAVIKGRMKKSYCDKLFSSDNYLIFIEKHSKCNKES